MKLNVLNYIFYLLIAVSILSCSDSGSRLTPKGNIEFERFSGAIAEGIGYSIEVGYVATKDTRSCKNWTLFGGVTPNIIYRRYYPTITDGQHAIRFPRNEISSASRCGWKPTFARLCIIDEEKNTMDWCDDFLALSHHYKGHLAQTLSSEEPIFVGCIKAKTYENIALHCEKIPKNYQSANYDINDNSVQKIRFPLLHYRHSGEEYKMNIVTLRDYFIGF